jgi:hypothetical protein
MLLVPDAIKIENVNVLSCQNIDDSLIGGTFCCYLLKCEIVELILLILGLASSKPLMEFPFNQTPDLRRSSKHIKSHMTKRNDGDGDEEKVEIGFCG